MTVEKIDNTALSSIAKIDNTAKGSISKVSNQSLAATRKRVALVVGAAGEVYWSNSSDLTSPSNWTLLDLGTSLHRHVCWGLDDSNKECWIITTNQTARPMRIAVGPDADALSDPWIPSGAGDWNDVKPTSTRDFPGQGYEVHFGSTGSAQVPTWMMSCVNNSTYAYYLTGTITDGALWTTVYRGFDSSGTNMAIRGPMWNRSASAEDSRFVLWMNDSSGDGIWENQTGIGKGDDGDWTKRFPPSAGTNKQRGKGGYGEGVWVIPGEGTAEQHLTGSSDAQTWGDLNAPALNREMNAVATDMSGTWIMVGDNGYIWTSSDNARTWSESRIPSTEGGTSYRSIRDIAYDNDGTWLAVGERSFYVSTNDGTSWTSFDISTSNNRTYQGVCFNVINSAN